MCQGSKEGVIVSNLKSLIKYEAEAGCHIPAVSETMLPQGIYSHPGLWARAQPGTSVNEQMNEIRKKYICKDFLVKNNDHI